MIAYLRFGDVVLPRSIEAKSKFQRMLCDCRADLCALETEIKDAAASVDHVAAGRRSNPALSALQGTISEAKAQLLQAHDPETS